MDETTKIIREYYDATVESEWNRIHNRPEFLLTCRMLDRYIKAGDRVLDIGGGPGRYSLYLAEKGCDVTLLDLSPENTSYAAARAAEQNLRLQTITGDAREADTLTRAPYDHVLLMGPMYHLLEEADRMTAVRATINTLRPGGVLFVSFISLFAGIVYYMKFLPDFTTDHVYEDYVKSVISGDSFGGNAFTKAFFTDQREILPFMARFPLDTLHLIGQEGITAPCESTLAGQGQRVLDLWLDLSEALWEREEFLSYSEHLMYVGRKQQERRHVEQP